MAAHLSCRGTPLCARPSGRLGAGVRPFAPLRSKVACRVTGENPFGGPSTSSSNGASTAQQQPKPEPAASDAAVAESRLELLEASVRGKKAAIEKAKRAIPIKGMVNKQQDQGPSNYANWPEGQLFPDGWDNMPLGQKVRLPWPWRGAAVTPACCSPMRRRGVAGRVRRTLLPTRTRRLSTALDPTERPPPMRCCRCRRSRRFTWASAASSTGARRPRGSPPSASSAAGCSSGAAPCWASTSWPATADLPRPFRPRREGGELGTSARSQLAACWRGTVLRWCRGRAFARALRVSLMTRHPRQTPARRRWGP